MSAYIKVMIEKSIPQSAVEGVRTWANRHKTPDVPLLIKGKETFTPREMLQQVLNGTALGAEIAQAFIGDHEDSAK